MMQLGNKVGLEVKGPVCCAERCTLYFLGKTVDSFGGQARILLRADAKMHPPSTLRVVT